MSLSLFLGFNPDNIAFFQLVLALFLGTFLGLERAVAGKVAGMRTFGLVSLGSCLSILISEHVVAGYGNLSGINPLMVAGAIVTGVGFLGAGLVIFKDSHVSGLTTAAGMWVAAAIGMAVGFRMYLIASFTTFLTLFVFTVMWYLERIIKYHVIVPMEVENEH
jgi:putative Mg2+ transporter-C (MgtC) family protein